MLPTHAAKPYRPPGTPCAEFWLSVPYFPWLLIPVSPPTQVQITRATGAGEALTVFAFVSNTAGRSMTRTTTSCPPEHTNLTSTSVFLPGGSRSERKNKTQSHAAVLFRKLLQPGNESERDNSASGPFERRCSAAATEEHSRTWSILSRPVRSPGITKALYVT